MSLRDTLADLDLRIAAVDRQDPKLAENLRQDMGIVRRYTPRPETERAVVVVLRILEQLLAHERAIPAARAHERVEVTPEECEAAFQKGGSLRNAALMLGVSHTTVRRWMKKTLEHVPAGHSNVPASVRR